ncbi:MAG: hypothetical protein AAF411_28030 [Myxococcota bacterium]
MPQRRRQPSAGTAPGVERGSNFRGVFVDVRFEQRGGTLMVATDKRGGGEV